MPKKKGLPPIVETWRKQAGKKDGIVTKREVRGISFQFPPGWGGDKVPHVKDGPFKGRVCWTTPQEKADIAARHEDMCGIRTRTDQ